VPSSINLIGNILLLVFLGKLYILSYFLLALHDLRLVHLLSGFHLSIAWDDMVHVQKWDEAPDYLNEGKLVIVFNGVSGNVGEPFVAVEANDASKRKHVELNDGATDAAHECFDAWSCDLSNEDGAWVEEQDLFHGVIEEMGEHVDYDIWNSHLKVKSQSLKPIDGSSEDIDELGINEAPFELNLREIAHVERGSHQNHEQSNQLQFGHQLFVNAKHLRRVQELET
jgi:hypothetical protein